MSDNPSHAPSGPTRQQHHDAAPTTQQMRTVGQRRREAEEKLEHHLEEARHKNEHQTNDGARPHTGSTPGGQVDATDVAAIQDDDSITPAHRVDLIANHAIPETDNKGARSDNDEA